MFWIVQTDLDVSNQRSKVVQALERLGIDYLAVELSHGGVLRPEVPSGVSGPIITNGSVMLTRIARERGWDPGGFLNDSFDYAQWSTHYASWLLNKQAVMTTIAEADASTASTGSGPVFVRPTLDNKSFNGRLMTREEFKNFKALSISGGKGVAPPDTPIILAPPKAIGQEHRHYIVDGEVITSSRYKLSGQPNFSEGADASVIDCVKEMIKKWVPARAFVLDTYVSGSEIGVVEIGGICHAGLYASDVQKLVAALDQMEFPTPSSDDKATVSKQRQISGH